MDILRSLLLSFFAVAVLLPVVRFALRRLSPARATVELDAEEIKYIQRKEWRLTLAYFFFASVLAVVSAGVLAMISSIVHMSDAHLHVLTPNFRALFAPGLLLGLTLALLPLRVVQSALLAQDYDLYRRYMQHTEGKNSTRSYSVLFLIMLVLGLVAAWFSMRWHVNVDEKQVQVTNLLLQQRTYSMQEIERIQFLGGEGEYLVSFSDNTTINTSYLKPVQFEMIALLAERSGQRVQR